VRPLRTRSLPNPRYDFMPFRGGIDFETPPIELPAGFISDSQNFEIGVNGKYIRSKGYERFDGRAKPSDAVANVVPVIFSGATSVGDTVTGLTSTSTGKVIAVGANYIVTTRNTGAFDDGEDLQVSAVTVAEVDQSIILEYTPKMAAQFKALAADEYRASITAVPGEGPVRGVFYLSGDWFAVRNATGNASAKVYKATISGWTEVNLGRQISFTSGGTTPIEEGNTITGATSGATATVTRIIIDSGSWVGGNASGRLILSTQTGNFAAENLNVGANTDLATVAGNSTAITLLPGGRFRTVRHNFRGSFNTTRIYGCDGVNRGFEFDGAVWVPIITGMPNDNPEHVVCHRNHLFFSFLGSVQHSATGEPYSWNPVLGATEFGVGDRVTGFNVEYGYETGSTLAIYSRNKVHMLYGTSSANWTLVQFRDEIGAYRDSIQNAGITLSVDDRGIANVAQSDAFGNFSHSTVSSKYQRWIMTRKNAVTGSCIVREKNQYRVFFADKSALYITMDGNKVVGAMTQQLDHLVTCMHSTETVDGREEIMFGSEDGFVYQMERGTSLDGDDLDAYFTLHFYHFNASRVIKKWLNGAIEAQGNGYAEFLFGYSLGYGSAAYHQPGDNLLDATFQASRWDEFTWDEFWWDGQSIFPVHARLSGSSENIAFTFRMTDKIYEPIEFSGINVRHYFRRYLR
jgi:hypothetical protein